MSVPLNVTSTLSAAALDTLRRQKAAIFIGRVTQMDQTDEQIGPKILSSA